MQDIRSAYRHTRRAALSLLAAAMPAWSQSRKADPPAAAAMQLGVFSVSLNVKDLAASRRFYEKLGFKPSAGADSKYLIMKNGNIKFLILHQHDEYLSLDKHIFERPLHTKKNFLLLHVQLC